MDYDKLLNNYNCIPIRVTKNLLVLSKKGQENRVLYSPIIFILNSLGINQYKQNLITINVTKEGLIFNYDSFKNVLSKYFNIPIDENFEKNVQHLKSILRSKDAYQEMPNFLKQKCDKYSNGIPNSKTKQQRKEFISKTLTLLSSFSDFIMKEEKYKKVPIDFDQDKLNLFLAYTMREYTIQFKKMEMTREYNKALEYLKTYLENNNDLLERSFRIPKFKKEEKPYQISSIKLFVDKEQNKEIKKTTEHNCNFFERTGKSAREFIDSCLARSNKQDNPIKLKQLLNRKINLYESMNYTSIKIGKDSFHGYFGFVLDNKKVILDKLFDDLVSGIISTSNPVYIIDENDFEKIAKMSKTQAIDSINLKLINAEKITHQGSWEEKITEKVYKK